ncbi:unnamed protein product [Orchesella dallaii]|uniref:CWF19-like protein 2 n=1 Tax=Orchesella dallaii TaxID=48710 RepID=A0ABP1QYP8_9HEXA
MGKHLDSSDEEVSDDTTSSEEEGFRSKKKSKKDKHLSSHKKKKSKDKKKHKKKSKKSRRRSSSSEGSSESEDEWVVKEETAPAKRASDEADSEEIFKKPKIEPVPKAKNNDQDEWNEFGNILPTFSNDGKKAERRKQKEEARASKSIDQLGQAVNELNPYWKDGGSGLPEEESQVTKPSSSSQDIGDGGLSWLRKAFIRAKEQAKEEGRTLEEVVSDRWGSLEKFLGMLEAAENKAKERERGGGMRNSGDHRRRDSRRFIQPNRDSDDEEESNRHSRYSSSSRSHRHHRERDRRRSRDRDRDSRSGWRKRGSPERSSESSRKRSPEAEIKSSSSRPPSTITTEPVAQLHPTFSSDRKTKTPQVKERRSSSPEEKEESPEVPTPQILTDKEMNELGAKLLKAEMFGNTALVDELKIKLKEAETTRENFIKTGGKIGQTQSSQTKIVTKVMMDSGKDRGRRVKDKITETHKDGQRVRYFPDDDKYTLQNMFQKEKMNTAADENALFARIAGKGAKTGVDYDADDVFTDRASSSKQVAKDKEREVRDVLDKEKEYKKILDSCPWCFESQVSEKHLIMSVGEKSYLCAPPYQSLAEGHCLIIPMSHVSCATDLDEDVWAEMQKFRKALVRMFREADQDMVIFETALYLKRHPHMYLECVPMPKETGELAPIYFKKAIQECETEWSHNKKLVELRNRDVRRAVPKGLPYFSVDFGDDSCGFAHVVEDERNFPRNFAHEIVGGMMELDHHLWRKQKKDDFKTQRTKVMEFLKLWGPYDWTRDPS